MRCFDQGKRRRVAEDVNVRWQAGVGHAILAIGTGYDGVSHVQVEAESELLVGALSTSKKSTQTRISVPCSQLDIRGDRTIFTAAV